MGVMYQEGIKALGKKMFSGCGCYPIVILGGTAAAIADEIKVGGTEYIVPTIIAAITLLGLGSLVSKIKK